MLFNCLSVFLFLLPWLTSLSQWGTSDSLGCPQAPVPAALGAVLAMSTAPAGALQPQLPLNAPKAVAARAMVPVWRSGELEGELLGRQAQGEQGLSGVGEAGVEAGTGGWGSGGEVKGRFEGCRTVSECWDRSCEKQTFLSPRLMALEGEKSGSWAGLLLGNWAALVPHWGAQPHSQGCRKPRVVQPGAGSPAPGPHTLRAQCWSGGLPV